MSAQGEVRDSHSDLKEAIATGALSEPLRVRAEGILARIERPVRLAALGLPGSGKSLLLNLLLGADILPEGVRLPTMRLSHGTEAEAICTLADGSTQTIPGANMEAIASLGAVYVEVKLPLPALTKLSMLEVVAGAEPAEQKRALLWAAKRTDIALWCTKDIFGRNEQDLWGNMPGDIQDHAFLMLTRADALAARGELVNRLEEVKASGRDYFKQILPIGTKAAIAARKPDGSVDKDALRSSGGVALISGILRAVETGRQAARDQAEVFLRQIDYTPRSKLEQELDDSLHMPKKQHETTAVFEELPSMADIDAANATKLKPGSREAVEQAVAQLTAEGAVMVDALSTGMLDEASVLDTCVDTVSWLADYLAESGVKDDPVMARARDAAVDAADLVQLIQLETGDTTTTDALSIMIQLKQEMQAALAA